MEQCYVVGTGKSGCFVRLAGGVSGRVLLKLLSDRFVSNPALEFPCGRLVAGKVLEKVGEWMGWFGLPSALLAPGRIYVCYIIPGVSFEVSRDILRQFVF